MRRGVRIASVPLLVVWHAGSALGEKGCGECHAPIQAECRESGHGKQGITCVSCHGKSEKHVGSKDNSVKPDVHFGMSKGGGPSQFKDRIPACCEKCHEDEVADFSRSQHATLIGQGDPNSAACTDCHGKHAIRKASDTGSPTSPDRVGELCARCHGDKELMLAYPSKYDIRAHLAKKVPEWSPGTAMPNCTKCHQVHTEMTKKQSRSRGRTRTSRKGRSSGRRSKPEPGVISLNDQSALPAAVANGAWISLDPAGPEKWRRSGKWAVSDGEMTAEQPRSLAVRDDVKLDRYAFSLEAQKLGGRSGLIVAFQVDDRKPAWLVGGFGGKHSEVSGIRGTRTDHAPAVDKWLRIDVVVSDETVDGYIDGKRCWSARRRGRHMGNFITSRPAGIGVGVWDSKAKFRRLRYMALE